MFPLGTVLIPGAGLPLHVFEPRYQQMLNDTLAGDRSFGVVLISRGSEVGGGETRTMVGTRATIEDYKRFDDGRAAIQARGVERIEIVEWLPDDPYPRAMVRSHPTATEVADGDKDSDADSDEAVVSNALVNAHSAFEEMIGEAVRTRRLDTAPDLSWPNDPEACTWHMAQIAPLNLLDRQRVLEADTLTERLAIIFESVRATTLDLQLMARLDDR